MVWRRLLVHSDSTIVDLHYTIQTAMGWSDVHLNRFRIHGQDFGVYHDGGICFSDNPEKVPLSAFGFRTRERFFYEYDFGDEWLHEVRIEKRLPLDPDVFSRREVNARLRQYMKGDRDWLQLQGVFASQHNYSAFIERVVFITDTAKTPA